VFTTDGQHPLKNRKSFKNQRGEKEHSGSKGRTKGKEGHPTSKIRTHLKQSKEVPIQVPKKETKGEKGPPHRVFNVTKGGKRKKSPERAPKNFSRQNPAREWGVVHLRTAGFKPRERGGTR